MTASSPLVGAMDVTYTFEFTIGGGNGSTAAGQGDVTVTFPAGFDVSSVTFVEAESTVGGLPIAGEYTSFQISGQQLQLVDFDGVLADGTTFVLKFEGITNAGTPGSKTIQLQVWNQTPGDLGGINTNGATFISLVEPSLDHFEVTAPGGGPIGNQSVGSTFEIQVSAIDSEGDPYVALDSAAYTVDVTIVGDTSGATGLGAVTLDFSATPGTAIHTVRLNAPQSAEVITVTAAGPPEVTGSSNAFNVLAPPEPPPADLVEEAGETVVRVVNRRAVPLDSDGGANVEITSPDGNALRVAVPAGALDDASNLRLEVAAVADQSELGRQAPPLGDAAVFASFVVRLVDGQGVAVPADFTEPVTLTFTLLASRVPAGVGEGDLLLSFWNGSSWIVVPATVTVSADGSTTVVATVTHFTLFQVTGIPEDWGTFSPVPHETGITLTAWQGGSLALFETALDGAAAWVGIDGEWRGYVSGAPAFVNARFVDIYADGVPRSTYLAFVR